MHWAYIVLILLLTCVFGSVIPDHSHCNYIYNHECSKSRNIPAGIEYKEAAVDGLCSVDDIRDDIKFTVQLAKDRSRSSGIAKVNFTLPNVRCNYEIAMLVNSSIKNNKECKNHVFHKTNSYDDEIHSSERTVCVLPIAKARNDCKALEKFSSNSWSTEVTHAAINANEKFSMWYEHIFTGCYALRFTVDGYKYSVLGNQFITTDYTRTEVTEPKFRCYYEERIMDETSKQELVTFALSISVNADTAGMILTLTPMSYPDETKENACVRYSEKPLYTWEISTDESTGAAAAKSKNCSLTTVQLDNETYTRDTECNFDLRASGNASYCLKIELDDERCNRQTIWKPPPYDKNGKPACAWLQSCTRIIKNTSIIEYSGILNGSKRTNLTDNNMLLLLLISIVVIIIILAIIATVLFFCRVYLRNSTSDIYVNKKIRDIKIARYNMEIESLETDDDDDDEIKQRSRKLKNNDFNDETEPIILLYARGANSFMNLMSDFREILKIRCGCRIRDWYDANEWDEVARIGPSTWVADLLRNEHRAIWIDTPRARKLLDSQWRNNYYSGSSNHPSMVNKNHEIEAISDFRDLSLPNVVDFAKRNVAQLGYNKHFVVRLEGFDTSNEIEPDPFEGLSPHTRYLIPHHLGELCSHLSSCWQTNDSSQRKSEEAQLRERLVQMTNN